MNFYFLLSIHPKLNANENIAAERINCQCQYAIRKNNHFLTELACNKFFFQKKKLNIFWNLENDSSEASVHNLIFLIFKIFARRWNQKCKFIYKHFQDVNRYQLLYKYMYINVVNYKWTSNWNSNSNLQ